MGLMGASKPRVMSTAEYLGSHQPRVSGLEYTAPAYDDVTKPVRAPFPAACLANKSRCGCYSQQGTRLDVPDSICLQIVAGGFFVAWDDEKGRQVAAPRQAQVSQPLAGGAEDVSSWISFGGSATPSITSERVSISQAKR
jgi:zona occludens toxin